MCTHNVPLCVAKCMRAPGNVHVCAKQSTYVRVLVHAYVVLAHV